MFISPLAFTAEPLTITEQLALDFGRVTNLDGTCSMSSTGTLTGSGAQDCFGTETPASFQIQGETNASFFISLVGSTTNGVTLSPIVEGGSSQILDGSGDLDITVYADLDFSSASADGPVALTYTLTVSYP